MFGPVDTTLEPVLIGSFDPATDGCVVKVSGGCANGSAMDIDLPPSGDSSERAIVAPADGN